VQVVNDAVDLGWETSHKQDLGFDFKLFNDNLSVIFDLFKEHRTDILLKRSSVPSYLGYMAEPYGNVGVVDNKGFDCSLEYNKKFNKDWAVAVRGNFTFNEDKWVDNDQPDQLYPWLEFKGSNVMGLRGYEALGLFTEEQAAANREWEKMDETVRPAKKPYATPYDNIQAGDIMFKDLNEDGKIDTYDRKWIGHGDVPKGVYGFGGNVQYKQLTIGFLFQGTIGAERFISGSSIHPFRGDGGGGNLYTNINDRWTVENPSQNVFYPRLAYGSDQIDNMNNFSQSTWWIKDMDFLRLKTMQISYNLPKKWFNNYGFRNVSVYMMGTNLFTFSKFKLWDPELNTSNGTKYPNIASYSAGINFSF
jgi:TonB-linked SusC/RagA family outer membrane protein